MKVPVADSTNDDDRSRRAQMKIAVHVIAEEPQGLVEEEETNVVIFVLCVVYLLMMVFSSYLSSS